MKNKERLDKTTNRKVFNYAYKKHLERTGKIRCSYCKYNRGENSIQKWYGGHWSDEIGDYDIKYPSWKMVSKNRKQWMNNNLKLKYNVSYRGNHYVDLIW